MSGVASMALAMLAPLLMMDGAQAALQFSAGWGMSLDQPAVNASWVNLQFGVSMEQAVDSYATSRVPSLYSFAWTELDKSRVTNATAGTCSSRIKRFGNTTHCKTMREDVEQAWAEAFESIREMIDNGTFIGVFLGDENLWDGTSMQNLSTVSELIKRDWPEAVVYINEAQDVVHCNFNRLGDPIFEDGQCWPESVDWVGYDYYCTIPSCTGAYGAAAGWNVQRDGMQTMVYPRLPREDQRVVPTPLGFFWKTSPFNQSILNAMDAYCEYNAEKYASWALQDDRLIGMFPFVWSSSDTMIGLSNLPRCLAKWVQIGKDVVMKASNLRDRGGPRRYTKRTCPSPEERSKYTWCSM